MQHSSTRLRIVLPLLAGAAALPVILPLALSVHVLEYDEAIFMDVARNIQRLGLPLRSMTARGLLFFDHTNLYVYLLSLYAHASETGILFARLVTAAFGLACIWLTFEIGAQVRSSASGFVAGLLLGVSPFFALHAFFVRMEVPMVCAMLAGLLLLVKNERHPRCGLNLMAGVMLAMAVLFKEVAVLFVGWCAAYVLFVNWRDHRPPVPAFAAVVAPPVLGLLAWAAWAWKLSPTAFTVTMQRWLNSMGAADLLDPRSGVGLGQWIQQISADLLGTALVAGLGISLVVILRRRGLRLEPLQFLLWGYLLSALGLSLVVRLKELRHLIGVLPVATLIIGTSVDWAAVLARIRGGRSWLMKAAFGLAAVAFLLLASPVQPPSGPVNRVASWLNTPYGWRLLENDRFYNVLRLTGLYLREHTDPAEVITVAHQATVTSYYADRRYQMLYTLPRGTIDAILSETRTLVWDDETFLALTPADVAALRHDIQARFQVERQIRDAERMVIIYQ